MSSGLSADVQRSQYTTAEAVPRFSAQKHAAGIPAALQCLARWVVFTSDKTPHSARTGAPASCTNPESWSSFSVAFKALREGNYHALGFALGDGIAGIDLDHCRNPLTGEIEAWAQKDITSFTSYTEISVSGKGVHIIIMGRMPEGGGRKRGNREAYSSDRFFIMTGQHLPATPATLNQRQEELDEFVRTYFPPQITGDERGDLRLCIPVNLSDEELRERALAAPNGAKFLALWNADDSRYDGDASRGDLALCQLLAFWTGRDEARIDRMFRQSDRRREKWDELRGAKTYGQMTIAKAIDNCQTTYTPSLHQRNVTDEGLGQDDATADEAAGNGESKRAKTPSKAKRLLHLVETLNPEIFLSEKQEAHATVVVGDHTETYAVRSTFFREWLEHVFYEAEHDTAGGQVIKDVTESLTARARHDGKVYPVFLRLAEHAGATYLHLADNQRRVVKITRQGWSILPSASPVRFSQPKGMKELPLPVRGGSIDELRPFVNISDENNWRLLVAWLIAALHPSGWDVDGTPFPFPILMLSGEMGSAKSTAAHMLRELVDPHILPLRAEPRNEHELAIAAQHAWILAFDNLSGIPTWLSDALCRISTGGGFAVRTFFVNDEETLFSAQRPMILTGIEEAANRGDLLDRTIGIELQPITSEQRRDERALWHDFRRAQPRILGALLDAVVYALDRLPDTTLLAKPRLADFALWVTAAEPALGWKAGSFLMAYQENRAGANSLALEASPLARAITSYMENRVHWEGTASALEAELLRQGDEHLVQSRRWPQGPSKLSNALRRVAPNLRRSGIEISYRRVASERRIILARYLDDAPNSKHDGTMTAHRIEPEPLEFGRDDGSDGSDGTARASSDVVLSERT